MPPPNVSFRSGRGLFRPDPSKVLVPELPDQKQICTQQQICSEVKKIVPKKVVKAKPKPKVAPKPKPKPKPKIPKKKKLDSKKTVNLLKKAEAGAAKNSRAGKPEKAVPKAEKAYKIDLGGYDDTGDEDFFGF